MRIILNPHSIEATNEIVSFLLNDKRIQQFVEDKELILTVAPDAAIGVPIRTDHGRTSRKARQDNNKKQSLDNSFSKDGLFLKICKACIEPVPVSRSRSHSPDGL